MKWARNGAFSAPRFQCTKRKDTLHFPSHGLSISSCTSLSEGKKPQLLFNHLRATFSLSILTFFFLLTKHAEKCAKSLLIETALLLQDNYCSVFPKQTKFFSSPSVFVPRKLVMDYDKHAEI